MAIDGIGRSPRPAQTQSTQETQRSVSPRPAAAALESNPIEALKDGFEKVAEDFGKLLNPAGPSLSGIGDIIKGIVQKANDTKKMGEIKDILKDSPTGAAAIKYLEDKKIPVEFADGGGSYSDGNKIVIDRSENSQEAALTLVHEINHAKASFDGPKADIVNDTRDKYVQTMLDEEVRGTVDSIKAKNELIANGKDVTATFPLEKQYNDAYKAAVADAKKKDPELTEEQLKAVGEKAGYDRVMEGFKKGEVVTSTNGQNYPEYYGSSWDANHPKP